MADKVLIVDDDISICKLLEKVMHSNELDTETAGSGRDTGTNKTNTEMGEMQRQH